MRWACLLHDLGKDATGKSSWPAPVLQEHAGIPLIDAVNKRVKAPRDCQELALLVGEFQTHGHRAPELAPPTLLELLQRFDVYRRPQRFEEFIMACEMDARGRPGMEERDYPQADYLRGAACAARSVAVGPLLEQGLQGQALGDALKQQRLRALEHYRTNAASGQRDAIKV